MPGFLKKFSLFFLICDFFGRMFELNSRNWLETEDFFDTTGENTEKVFKGIPLTVF